MADQYFYRHQDNVLDVGATHGTIEAGQRVPGLQLQLDPDAPFDLRSLAVRMDSDIEEYQNNLQFLWIKWKRADGGFFSTDFMPLLEFMRAFGQGGNPKPIWPHELYPASGVIEVDLWNNNPSVDLDGVQVVFRGVRLYSPRPGLYPATIRELKTYAKSLKVTGVGITPTSGGDLRNIPVLPQLTGGGMISSDFVIRSISAGQVYNPASGAFFPARNLYLTIRDGDGKPYSNAPIDINILAQGPMFTGSQVNNPLQFGPWHPGLLYSEIYVPKNQSFFVDILRDDGDFSEQEDIQEVRVDLVFKGVKVIV